MNVVETCQAFQTNNNTYENKIYTNITYLVGTLHELGKLFSNAG